MKINRTYDMEKVHCRLNSLLVRNFIAGENFQLVHEGANIVPAHCLSTAVL